MKECCFTRQVEIARGHAERLHCARLPRVSVCARVRASYSGALQGGNEFLSEAATHNSLKINF